MPRVEIFSSIEEMKAPQPHKPLTETEALERALDLVDFYAALRHASARPAPETYPGIEWIELKMRDDSQ